MNNDLIAVSASKLLQKCRCHEDIVNICRELGFFFPKESGFDGKFFLQWGAGQKKLFELGKVNGYSFRYFSKDKLFTKEHLIKELDEIPNARLYIPDDINPKSLTRDYLFCILETTSPAKYVQLYNKYKEKLAEKGSNNWAKYQVLMSPDLANKLKEFNPNTENKKFKPFRKSKLGKNVGMFQNLNNFHEMQINNGENILNEDEPNLDEELNIQ